jgi:hypothetical protein
MRMFPLGPVLPRFTAISSSTNANPIVITTSAPHGFALTDTISIVGHLVNTNAVGTFTNSGSAQFTLTASTITLVGVAGNGSGVATGTASAPRQLITVASFPVIPGVDNTKLLVAQILFTPGPFGTAPLFIGNAALNQATFQGVMRPVNPPPASGIYDYYDLQSDGNNIFPIAEYWVDSTKPGTEGLVVTFWVR